MGGGSFLDAVELDQHDALAQPFFVSLGGVAAIRGDTLAFRKPGLIISRPLV